MNPRRCIKQDSEPNTLPTRHSDPPPPPILSILGQPLNGTPGVTKGLCQVSFFSTLDVRPLSIFPSSVQWNCLLVGCLTSQQHASVSQGRVCSDNCTCCHTEIEVADQTFHLTQSQYTDTGPTSPSTDPITPGAWQGSH